MVYKQKESANWWYKFTWNGKLIRESTKQTNKRLAETMEAAHKSALAKGEVGIREREPAPTLKTFGEDSFLPFVRSTRAEKPNTVRFYKNSVANLSAYSKLADLPLDQINSEIVAGFVARRQLDQVQVSTINRDLATLRRMFHLAIEWGSVKTLLPRIKLFQEKTIVSGSSRSKKRPHTSTQPVRSGTTSSRPTSEPSKASAPLSAVRSLGDRIPTSSGT